jgi:hypothetical protein
MYLEGYVDGCWMNTLTILAWLVCKHRSKDYIADMCNGVEQLQLEWTGGLDSPKEHRVDRWLG